MPAQVAQSLREMLSEATEKAAKYEWMSAAKSYRQALDAQGSASDPLETASLAELMARSYFKGAFQSESHDEFKRRMQLAEASYEQARALHERAGAEAAGKSSRARAMFAGYWHQDNADQRRRILYECLSLAMEALQTFERQGNTIGFAETGRDILVFLFEAVYLDREWTKAKEHYESAFQIGEKAADEFEKLGSYEGVIECLSMTLNFLPNLENILGPKRYRELTRRAEQLAVRLAQASAKTATPLGQLMTTYGLSLAANFLQGDVNKALDLCENAFSKATELGESYLAGISAAAASYCSRSAANRGEDVERKRFMYEKSLQYAPTSARLFEISLHGGGLAWACSESSECYIALARFVETEPEKKKSILQKAVEAGRKSYHYRDHGGPGESGGHAFSKALYFLSTVEDDPQERASLLREALRLREEYIREADLLFYPRSWSQGIGRNYLALIKSELSGLSDDPKLRIQLLREAVTHMQECVEFCTEYVETDPGNMLPLSWYEEWHGDILLQLFDLTREADWAQRATKAYQDAISILRKLEQTGPTAALYWKTAKAYDMIGDYKEASRAFNNATEAYRRGAQKVPGLAPAFEELATYMDAWTDVEQARIHHNEEQYLLAAESYTRVADMLRSTKTWNPLVDHYLACSFLEGGEALSRQERPEAAVESFSAAMKEFRKAGKALEGKLREATLSRDVQELRDWLQVTQGRERYSLGRLDLEEARVLDKKGEKSASSAKYRSALAVFRQLESEARTEQGRREFGALVISCEALAAMNEAEARASPELYSKAAEWFTKAKDAATRERLGLLALANSSLCKALEAGTRFRLTRDSGLYSQIKKHLETAQDYYGQAGLENAAEWTQATQRLFDALVYLANAEVEVDSKRKAELYHLAEKHLELSAKLYSEAGYPSKKEEALRHLRRAQQEKRILLTPIEALAENPTISGVSVAPVSLTRDQALGLDRFQVANVVGNLTVSEKKLGVGTQFVLELEVANMGKTAATLIKVENIMPEGVELQRQGVPYRIEDNFINMKGKRLEYLKTYELKIPMKALLKGTFELRPRILFVDETGNYRSYEFEPAALTVTELGISGWLKGPKKG